MTIAAAGDTVTFAKGTASGRQTLADVVVAVNADGTAIGSGHAGTYTTETNSTITLGGTAQNAVAANTARTKLKFQNLSVGDMYVKMTGTAASGTGMLLPAGSFYEWEAHDIPTGALSVFGATTGQAYYVAEG